MYEDDAGWAKIGLSLKYKFLDNLSATCEDYEFDTKLEWSVDDDPSSESDVEDGNESEDED